MECLAALAPLITDQLVVTNVARTAFEWKMAKPREGNLYTMGMGLVTPVALGLALALPHRGVVALDGDGGILLNLGALATVANCAPANLVSVIFDNEAYASTGGLPTATAGRTDLAGIAKAAGIANSTEVRTPAAFAEAAVAGLADGGPCVIVAKVESEIPKVEPKLMDGRENKYRFVRYIESLEDRVILKPSAVGRVGLCG
jgi:sulfopyruvate decarboxylase subunit beta